MKQIRVVRSTGRGAPCLFLSHPLKLIDLKPDDIAVVEVRNDEVVIRKARPEDVQ